MRLQTKMNIKKIKILIKKQTLNGRVKNWNYFIKRVRFIVMLALKQISPFLLLVNKLNSAQF
jgi:hypothetical protein